MERKKRKGFANGLSSLELRCCGDWCGEEELEEGGAERKN